MYQSPPQVSIRVENGCVEADLLALLLASCRLGRPASGERVKALDESATTRRARTGMKRVEQRSSRDHVSLGTM